MSEAAVRRYADALFELARDKALLPEVVDGVDGVRKALSASPDLVAKFKSVRTTQTEKREFVDQQLTVRAHPYVRNALKLLIDRNRGDDPLFFVLAFFERMEAEQGVVKVLVESARGMGDLAAEDLAKRLSTVLGKKVSMEAETLPELLGGIRVTIGSKRIDASIKKQLDNLETRLRSAI
ncbi:MAG: ATP synthase F1 subunit delta [Planctomycetota bacterium]